MHKRWIFIVPKDMLEILGYPKTWGFAESWNSRIERKEVCSTEDGPIITKFRGKNLKNSKLVACSIKRVNNSINNIPSYKQKAKNKRIKRLTKELSKDSGEEAQIARNVICHSRWKRLHDGVNAKYSLKKLQNIKIQIKMETVVNQRPKEHKRDN